MKKAIQTVIKEAAERYGLNYDESSVIPKVKDENGVIKELTIQDLKTIFK